MWVKSHNLDGFLFFGKVFGPCAKMEGIPKCKLINANIAFVYIPRSKHHSRNAWLSDKSITGHIVFQYQCTVHGSKDICSFMCVWYRSMFQRKNHIHLPTPPHSGNFYTKAGYSPGFVYIPENVHFVNLYKLAKIWKKQSLQDWMIVYDDLLHLVFMFTNGWNKHQRQMSVWPCLRMVCLTRV